MTKEIKSTGAKIAVRILLITPLLIPSPLLKIYPFPPPLYVQLLDQAQTSQSVDLSDYAVSGKVVEKGSGKGIANTSVVVLWGRWTTDTNRCKLSNVGKTDKDGKYVVSPPRGNNYRTRKKIEGTHPRVIFYKDGFRSAQLNYDVGENKRLVHTLVQHRNIETLKRLTYLEDLTNEIRCFRSSTPNNNLYAIKYKIYSDAKTVAKTNTERDKVRSLCIDALEEKIRSYDPYIIPLEVDRLLKLQGKVCD